MCMHVTAVGASVDARRTWAQLMARLHSVSMRSGSEWLLPVLESRPANTMGSSAPSSSGSATCHARARASGAATLPATALPVLQERLRLCSPFHRPPGNAHGTAAVAKRPQARTACSAMSSQRGGGAPAGRPARGARPARSPATPPSSGRPAVATPGTARSASSAPPPPAAPGPCFQSSCRPGWQQLNAWRMQVLAMRAQAAT